MLSRFFVNRPIFAWVIAISIMIAGVLAIFNLPVSQYPNIAPPQVTVTATYPGASAETMSRTVTQVIEQNMTGLDGLIYMSSTSDSTIHLPPSVPLTLMSRLSTLFSALTMYTYGSPVVRRIVAR